MKKKEVFTMKEWLESEAYLSKRAEIHAENNSDSQLRIDRSEFKKSPLEREKLRDMKISFRKLKKNPELHANSITEFFKSIIGSKIPNWGSLMVKA